MTESAGLPIPLSSYAIRYPLGGGLSGRVVQCPSGKGGDRGRNA